MTGWKLVPTEPDEAMIEAGIEFRYDSIKHGYAAMIAASPPVGEELAEAVAREVRASSNLDGDAEARGIARAILKLHTRTRLSPRSYRYQNTHRTNV